MSTQVDTDHFRAKLLAEREKVANAIAHLREKNSGSLEDALGELVSGSADNHMADTATETVDREIDYTLEENSGNVLREIDRALARIDDGTYGTCSACGHAIEPERLEFLPWAAFCASDARSRG
jgi:RNA polymerase-binding transcription factor DksA